MKIAKIEAIPIGIPFTHPGPPWVFLGKPRNVYEALLVRVETDTGLVGWGEAHQTVWRAVLPVLEDFVGPALTGRDASDVTGLMRQARQFLYTFGGGNGIVLYALSAVDIALWDLAGKAAGLPLHRLFGAGGAAPLTGYASLGFYRDPEIVVKGVHAAIEAGYRHIKIHSIEEQDVRAAREAAGPEVRLMVDASGKWSPQQAREALRRFEQYDLLWLEEPIFPPNDFAATARLRDASRIPIAAGENAATAFEFKAMFEAGAVDYATPCLNKVGGVTELRKVAVLAEAYGVELAAQCAFFGPAYLAMLHCMADQPRPLIERFFCSLEWDLAGPAGKPVGGQFRVPSGPGLGHDPEPELLREFRLRQPG